MNPVPLDQFAYNYSYQSVALTDPEIWVTIGIFGTLSLVLGILVMLSRRGV